MVKKITGSGAGSTPQIHEGDLAAQQKDITALLGSISGISLSSTPEISYESPEHDFNFPKTPILDALENYITASKVTFHVPGHGQSEGVLPKLKEVLGEQAVKADTTDDFDGLGQLLPPGGAIKEAQELAAKAFGAEHTFFLVNGSTVGNLALTLAATRPGEKVLMARNCHRSVVSGLSTTGAVPVWVLPERIDEWGLWGAVKPEAIEQALKQNPDAKTVWLTNPTYEGIVSDIKEIAAICKKHNVVLIVDEAHGSHWPFNDNLPESAITLGADAVVNSIHKTAGSFSQSSMLHLAKNSRIDYDDILCSLKMLMSTSPSYTLLASLDAARAYLDSHLGRNKIARMVAYSNIIRKKINNIDGCRCLSYKDGYNIDPTKIYITIEDISGRLLKDILEKEFHIETEAKTDKGILALACVGNTTKELDYLYETVKNIASRKFYYEGIQKEQNKYMPFSIPEMVLSPRDAYFHKKVKMKPEEAVGRISAEIVALCPPGIPILVPGERIQKEHLHYIYNKDYLWVLDS